MVTFYKIVSIIFILAIFIGASLLSYLSFLLAHFAMINNDTLSTGLGLGSQTLSAMFAWECIKSVRGNENGT